jgi:hypothetical protein
MRSGFLRYTAKDMKSGFLVHTDAAVAGHGSYTNTAIADLGTLFTNRATDFRAGFLVQIQTPLIQGRVPLFCRHSCHRAGSPIHTDTAMTELSSLYT